MKPIELTKGNNLNAYSETYRKYLQYKDKDCVIAYKKSFMGAVFLIKGTIEHFGFVFLDEGISKWGSADLSRKSLREIYRLLANTDGEVIILDEEQYKIFERKVLFSSINGG